MAVLAETRTGQPQEAAGTLKDSALAKNAAETHMVDKVTEPIGEQADAGSKEPGATKFTYASGSRPLEGYTIKRGIGRGGFGEVYYATSDGGKEVALKLIRRNLDIELRGATQCLNLKHPNLLGLYDIKHDETDDSWLVMEYVADESLDDVLRANPDGMSIEDAMFWFHGIAAGVACLHDHGIVHRDLKPGNIFSDQGIVKVGDYGLSKFISVSRRSGQTESVGTVHYMAPEVGNGRYGKEIDIYALGIILYEMLTGRVPFEGESVGEILMKHLTAEPELSRLPEPFRTAVARALTKDPDKRLRSVEEMVALLPPPGGAGFVARTVQRPQATPNSDPAAKTANGAAGTGTSASANIASAEDEEPVLRLVRDSWHQSRGWWDEKKVGMSPLVKLLILAGATLGLLVTAQVWIPALFILTLVYGVYYVVRSVVLSFSGNNPQGVVSAAAPAAPAESGRRKRRRRRSWHEENAPKVLTKTGLQKTTELVGSLLLATLVAAGLSVLMMVYQGRMGELQQYAWLVTTSALGAWAVLIPAKIWEGRTGEPALRRFVMMIAGFGVAVVSYSLASALMINLMADAPGWVTAPRPDHEFVSRNFYSPEGEPLLSAHLAYFGVMFLILRWWLQADPLRPVRFSLITTIWIVMVAWGINMVAQFPQPWGVMIFANITVAVQMAAAWMGPRNKLAAAQSED